MSKERDYEEIFQKVVQYEQNLHEQNLKRIRVGIKCIWLVPLIFLVLLFGTGSNKVIFLILWIVSLFAISTYLIVVEYSDYKLQEKIMELKGEEGEIESVSPADFDRAAEIIRTTRKMIGESLNSKAETEELIKDDKYAGYEDEAYDEYVEEAYAEEADDGDASADEDGYHGEEYSGEEYDE